MRYGLIERRRTTPHEDTHWYWVSCKPDNIDRVYTGEEDQPNNSLFWHYPEKYTKEEAVDIMLKKQKNEIKEEIKWRSIIILIL